MDLSGIVNIRPLGPAPFTLVEDISAFDAMMDSLRQVSRMAIDIEADSLYHYFDKVCLIQVSIERETFILDPLAVSNLSALGPIMSDPNIEKVFHAAGYDIFCLQRDYHFRFSNIFDTHIAAQLLGYEHLGLSALMEILLSIAHSKRCQRDDWSRRPLVAEQLDYAAMDTHHLLHIRDILSEQLEAKGRRAWATEEFAAAAAGIQQEKEFDPEGYRRIKGSRDLSAREILVLRALFILRERYARELDLPPFKVLNNPILLDLARRPPRSPHEMFKRPGISYRVARKFAEEIFHTISIAQAEDPASLAAPVKKEWKPPTREARNRLERLKAWRQDQAAKLQLHVGVVFPGSLLEAISNCPPGSLSELENFDGMRRWRAQEFGVELLETLRAKSPARSAEPAVAVE
jgi:ribonuclease D